MTPDQIIQAADLLQKRERLVAARTSLGGNSCIVTIRTMYGPPSDAFPVAMSADGTDAMLGELINRLDERLAALDVDTKGLS